MQVVHRHRRSAARGIPHFVPRSIRKALMLAKTSPFTRITRAGLVQLGARRVTRLYRHARLPRGTPSQTIASPSPRPLLYQCPDLKCQRGVPRRSGPAVADSRDARCLRAIGDNLTSSPLIYSIRLGEKDFVAVAEPVFARALSLGRQKPGPRGIDCSGLVADFARRGRDRGAARYRICRKKAIGAPLSFDATLPAWPAVACRILARHVGNHARRDHSAARQRASHAGDKRAPAHRADRILAKTSQPITSIKRLG